MEKSNEFIMKPTVDFCFKELMAEEKVRQGFIGAILNVDPAEIKETRLMPTLLRKGSREEKLGILDVRVLLYDGKQMDLEMQVAPFEAWAERTLFYLLRMYQEQIREGQDYDVIQKCIHVGILDFLLFPDYEGYYSRFHIWEDSRREKYTDKLEIHVLELPKLKEYQSPETELLKWAKFFHAQTREEFEVMAKENEYLEKAYERLVNLSADEKKRREYQAREDAIRDYNWQMKTNFRRGVREGMERGIAQGMERGLKVLITTLREVGFDEQKIQEKIMKEYDMDEKQAKQCLDECKREDVSGADMGE